MRATLAIVLVALIAGLTTMDPLICPDGCPDSLASHALESSAPHADCLICYGWGSTAVVPDAAPIVIVSIARPVVVASLPPLHFRPIEHPPKHASLPHS